MKKELEFVGSFAMSVLLLAGSFAVAQSATTAKPKKPSPATASAVATSSAGQGAATTQTPPAAPIAGSQASVTPANSASTAVKPKTMVNADNRTIPVPQL